MRLIDGRQIQQKASKNVATHPSQDIENTKGSALFCFSKSKHEICLLEGCVR